MSIPAAAPADRQWWMQVIAGRAAGSAPALPAAAEAASPVQIESAVKEVNATLESRSVGVYLEVDKDLDTLIVKVIDKESGELIRQMPTEEAVRIAKVLQGKLPGLLVSHQA
ncbi:flagellar protein FlaG [Variovorax sp. GB1R11]|jgi:flagellar protein FlaG|uniref:flagellar protein FlaG n=1 Tax=Variovorax sp. GB1R11 TaxID=3443741 RepID=UPI003F4719A6